MTDPKSTNDEVPCLIPDIQSIERKVLAGELDCDPFTIREMTAEELLVQQLETTPTSKIGRAN